MDHSSHSMSTCKEPEGGWSSQENMDLQTYFYSKTTRVPEKKKVNNTRKRSNSTSKIMVKQNKILVA